MNPTDYANELKQRDETIERQAKRSDARKWTVTFEIADLLLLDGDDLVQKGYGWMLKAASQSHESEVFDYVIRNKHQMPRTALRYAIEKMPAEMKRKAMVKEDAKRRRKRPA